MGLEDGTPSAGAFTRWAIGLVLPIVLSAVAMPRIVDGLRRERDSLRDNVASSDSPPEAPSHTESPARAEIEAATASAVDVARLQQRNLEGSQVFAPRGVKTAPDGARVAPFQGFGLSIGTSPMDAHVRVGGEDIGLTPIVTTVDCEPEQDVEVVVEKPGYRPVRRHVRCRADTLLELSIPLSRSGVAR